MVKYIVQFVNYLTYSRVHLDDEITIYAIR